MNIYQATNQQEWDSFLKSQIYSPFLQSWTMGEVYRDIGEEPIRLEIRESNHLIGICQAIVVTAKRGKHLAIPYGPVLSTIDNVKSRNDHIALNNKHSSSLSQQLSPITYTNNQNYNQQVINNLINNLKQIAIDNNCSFIRMSPFFSPFKLPNRAKSSPLHLLAEHIWYLPLTKPNKWNLLQNSYTSQEEKDMVIHNIYNRKKEDILKEMRQNHRNLIRRADREEVKVVVSQNPMQDIEEFFRLYDETRKRHHFVPYPNNFIRSQVRRFSKRNECTLYLAKYRNEVIATSIHMHLGGETSYHHGASTHKYPKIPASYALQWKAINDAISRGDSIFNFWGIAPKDSSKKHPFAGVKIFKTGFGGKLLELQHCFDIPVSNKYYLTKTFETLRKWHRGF